MTDGEMSNFNAELFQDICIPDLGSEIAVISGTDNFISANLEEGQPKVMDLLDYIMDDENTNKYPHESIFKSTESILGDSLDVPFINQEESKKFQLRIKAAKRKYTKHKKEDPSNKKIDAVNESVGNKLKRPRGRPRIYKTPQDRPKYYYTKKDKTSLKSTSSSLCHQSDDEPIRGNGKTKDKMRRDELKTTLTKMKLIVPGLTEKTDKATVIENASQYALFLKEQIGDAHDREFLELLRIGG